jgi:hypothetical protein
LKAPCNPNGHKDGYDGIEIVCEKQTIDDGVEQSKFNMKMLKNVGE